MSNEQATRARRMSGRGALYGAMFLMATSAVGPGFITQTSQFTAKLGAAMAFAILVSIVIDIAIQLNVWRIVGVSGRRAQDLANSAIPGSGYLLAALVILGGLIFNVGNVGGTAIGANALIGLDPRIAGVASALIAIAIFLTKRAGVALDRIVVVLGALMIALALYSVFVSGPPVGEALTQAVVPDTIDFLVITTLIGGTVGGYITYAGAHRMIDTGVTGMENIKQISRASVSGIVLTGIIRVLLFLAVLGAVAAGASLVPGDEAASAFQAVAGEAGLRLFGLIFWVAAITSVIGASYTSVSFLVSFAEGLKRHRDLLVVGFIAVTTVIYVLIEKAPATLLVLAGSLNGLILPVGVGILLWIAYRRADDLLGGYRYPRWLLIVGVLAWLLTVYMGWNSLTGIAELWSGS